MTTMNDHDRPAVPLTDIEAARMLLGKMGLSPADLLHEPAVSTQAPSFADYIPRVSAAATTGTRRVYGTYWKRVIEVWAARPLTSVTPLEISQLAEQVKASVVQRRNARGGRGAAEHLIGALRCVYKHAVADGILTEEENPAARVPKPRRLRSTRRALPDSRLEELSRVAGSTGDDPALDALLLRLHIETACRRGGALALRPDDLDAEHCLVKLSEKGCTMRWQPVSPTLMSHLLAHAESRGGLESGQRLLRYRNGRPITSRRYDYLWRRLGEHLPWVATQQVSSHWIRHTTLTWVERNFGFAVAQAYAGHEDHGRGGRAMATYIRAGLSEVATALAALTGEPHPLAIPRSIPLHDVSEDDDAQPGGDGHVTSLATRHRRPAPTAASCYLASTGLGPLAKYDLGRGTITGGPLAVARWWIRHRGCCLARRRRRFRRCRRKLNTDPSVASAVSSGRRNTRQVRELRWDGEDRERCRRSRSGSSTRG
jgi:integrase/recombinase XerC